MKHMKTNKYIAFVLVLLLTGVFSVAQDIKVPLRFDHYYTYEQVVEALRQLNRSYPGLTAIEEVGKSDEGRSIWALTINNPETGDYLSKPGFLRGFYLFIVNLLSF